MSTHWQDLPSAKTSFLQCEITTPHLDTQPRWNWVAHLFLQCVLYTPPRHPRLRATRHLKKTTPTHEYPQLLYYWSAVNRRTHKIKWPCKTLNWDIWKGTGYLPSNEWVLIQDLQEFRTKRKHLGVKASKDSRWRRYKRRTERENDFRVNWESCMATASALVCRIANTWVSISVSLSWALGSHQWSQDCTG